MRIALFGGSFDPIHHGHLIIARAIAEHFGIDQVVLLPSRNPPHKPNVRLAHPDHRLAMVRLATAGDRLFACSDHDLTCAGPSYTAHTVAYFHQAHPADELFWIIGADSLCELHTWYQPTEIIRHCRIVTAARPGFAAGSLTELTEILPAEAVARIRSDVVETPRIEISATDIRRRVQAGLSVRYLVPDAVADFITANGLYR